MQEVTTESDLILDALDTLALALANSDHHWSDDEKIAYELAVELLTFGDVHGALVHAVSGPFRLQ